MSNFKNVHIYAFSIVIKGMSLDSSFAFTDKIVQGISIPRWEGKYNIP